MHCDRYSVKLIGSFCLMSIIAITRLVVRFVLYNYTVRLSPCSALGTESPHSASDSYLSANPSLCIDMILLVVRDLIRISLAPNAAYDYMDTKRLLLLILDIHCGLSLCSHDRYLESTV